jgi:hypothetical protein
MYRWFAIYVASLMAAVVGLSVWGCIGLNHHAIVALDKLGDAGVQFGRAGDAVTQVAAKVNGKHGTIAMADEDIGAAKSLIIHADLVARHEQQQLKTWDERGTELFSKFGALLDSATKATDAAAPAITKIGNAASQAGGTADQLTENLDTLNSSERQLEDPNGYLAQFMKHAANTADHADVISDDFETLTNKITHPAPCTGKLCPVKRAMGAMGAVGKIAEFMYYLRGGRGIF